MMARLGAVGAMALALLSLVPEEAASIEKIHLEGAGATLYERYDDPRKSAALKRFVAWGLTEGQAYSADLGYLALPPDVAALARAAVERIQ